MLFVVSETSTNHRGGRAWHSALEPHVEAIQRWRWQRKSWREIAALLAAEKGITVTLHAPYQFMRRRAARGVTWEDSGNVNADPQTSIHAASKSNVTSTSTRSAPALPSRGFQTPDRKSFDSDDYL
jgi:hypothetical protein